VPARESPSRGRVRGNGPERRRGLRHRQMIQTGDGRPASSVSYCRFWVSTCGSVTLLTFCVSPRLTPLVPQTLHRTSNRYRFPWSERCDRIFRNEEVAGSNPASSTNALVRALSVISNVRCLHDFGVRCPTHAPQDACPRALCRMRGCSIANRGGDIPGLVDANRCSSPAGLVDQASLSLIPTSLCNPSFGWLVSEAYRVGAPPPACLRSSASVVGIEVWGDVEDASH